MGILFRGGMVGGMGHWLSYGQCLEKGLGQETDKALNSIWHGTAMQYPQRMMKDGKRFLHRA